MSKEQVREFFERVEEDEKLQQELEVLDKETSDKQVRENSIDKIVDIAKNAGFIFAKKDFISIVTEKARTKETKSNETTSNSKSCTVAWDWDDCYKMYDIKPPSYCEQGGEKQYFVKPYRPGDEDKDIKRSKSCGQGTAYIPPGYQDGDEDKV